MIASQALQYAQVWCKEQGAVFRETGDIDRVTLEAVVADPELRSVERRSINGTISSLKTMRRNHPEILAGLPDGPYCVLWLDLWWQDQAWQDLCLAQSCS
eukprot:SAG31_NODE_18001_length_650_cov_0.925590_1_plen_99_part_10